MGTKLRIGFNQKIGKDFGSIGAEASIETELDAATLNDHTALWARIHQLQTLVSTAVHEELAVHQAEPPKAPAREPEPAHRSNGDGNANGYRKERREWASADHGEAATRTASPPRRDDRSTGGGRSGGQGGGRQDGPPRSGKALFAWARSQEEGGARDVVKQLQRWGKQQNLPARFVDWSADEVRDGYTEAQNWLD